MKLKNKLNKAEEEIRVLKAKMYKMDNEMKVKYDNQDIHFSDTEYIVHDNSWRNTIPVRQEIILSQIKSDNLDEIIEKIVTSPATTPPAHSKVCNEVLPLVASSLTSFNFA